MFKLKLKFKFKFILILIIIILVILLLKRENEHIKTKEGFKLSSACKYLPKKELKKDWLYYMFGNKPYTYDTGEDMHLCFTSKLNNIKSFIGEQLNKDDVSDNINNSIGMDDKASSREKGIHSFRQKIEKHWVKQGIKSVEL